MQELPFVQIRLIPTSERSRQLTLPELNITFPENARSPGPVERLPQPDVHQHHLKDGLRRPDVALEQARTTRNPYHRGDDLQTKSTRP